VVLAPPEITMHEAVALRQKTGAPIAMVEDGKLIGVVGDTEIYRGILRQTELAG
jgi:glycine betaine/proline transport system ATP-binding protein